MKVSIFSNDKTTARDEVILSICILIALTIGIALVCIKPSLGFIDASNFVVIGVLLIMIAVMFIPCIIWRFMHNTEMNNKTEADTKED